MSRLFLFLHSSQVATFAAQEKVGTNGKAYEERGKLFAVVQ